MNIKEFANELQAIAETLRVENNVQFCHVLINPNNGLESHHLDSWLNRYDRIYSKADNWRQDIHDWKVEGINIATIERGEKRWRRAIINYNYARK